MKSTGIVRKIDELGRIVIPKELRNTLDMKEFDPIEIYVDGDKIIFEKYVPGCVITGEMDDLVEYNGKIISKKVIKELSKLL